MHEIGHSGSTSDKGQVKKALLSNSEDIMKWLSKVAAMFAVVLSLSSFIPNDSCVDANALQCPYCKSYNVELVVTPFMAYCICNSCHKTFSQH